MVKRSKKAMPVDYFVASFRADRSFGLMTLATISLLLPVSATYRFKAAWLAVPIFAILIIVAAVRWVVHAQRASKFARVWYEAHPYRGPGPKVLGPIRNFLRSQPLVVGLVVGVVIMAAMLIAIFQLVPPDY